MVSLKEAASELLARRRARSLLYDYILYTSPEYKPSAFAETVCAALDKFLNDVKAGKRPVLILEAPPQHGKSEIVSRKLPAFLLGSQPSLRIAAASYSSTLSDSMSLEVRRNLASPLQLKLFHLIDEKRRYP